MSAQVAPAHRPLQGLPVVTLYVTERCNSRCVSCDYWRHGRKDMPLANVMRLLPSFRRLGTQLVVLSGGEPLLNPQWAAIADCLRDAGLKVWLLTSGLSLAKHAARAAPRFDAVTVSLDGADAATYAAIRGLDAFDHVCAGIRAMAGLGAPVHVRVTLQRANFIQLPALVELAKDLGARSVSFLAIDVANPAAFGRAGDFASDLALETDDLAAFEQVLERTERDHAADFRSGFIAESPQKLRRLLAYFGAIRGRGAYPEVRCNAPEFSAVIGATGRVQPCFFIPGPANSGRPGASDTAADALDAVLNREAHAALRAQIRAGQRPECATCVCSMWRDPDTPGLSAARRPALAEAR